MDYYWFFAGMATDSIVVAALLVLLGPWVISRWIKANAFPMLYGLMADPRMNQILQDFIAKRIAGNLGGRPPKLGGIIKTGIAYGAQALVERAVGWIASAGLNPKPPGEQTSAIVGTEPKDPRDVFR